MAKNDWTEIENFKLYTDEKRLDEMPVIGISSTGAHETAIDFNHLDLRKSRLQNAVFHKCRFSNTSFIEVTFEACDFSNCDFTDSYFEKCKFIACKCMGAIFSGAILKKVNLTESRFQYANFNRAQLTDVALQQVDFTETALSEAVLKRFAPQNVQFIRTNFFKTKLAGVDFTNSELLAPTVSMPPDELRGATLNAFQAADLMRLWGVIVNP